MDKPIVEAGGQPRLTRTVREKVKNPSSDHEEEDESLEAVLLPRGVAEADSLLPFTNLCQAEKLSSTSSEEEGEVAAGGRYVYKVNPALRWEADRLGARMRAYVEPAFPDCDKDDIFTEANTRGVTPSVARTGAETTIPGYWPDSATDSSLEDVSTAATETIMTSVAREATAHLVAVETVNVNEVIVPNDLVAASAKETLLAGDTEPTNLFEALATDGTGMGSLNKNVAADGTDSLTETVATDGTGIPTETVAADGTGSLTEIVAADGIGSPTETVAVDDTGSPTETAAADGTRSHTETVAADGTSSHTETVAANGTGSNKETIASDSNTNLTESVAADSNMEGSIGAAEFIVVDGIFRTINNLLADGIESAPESIAAGGTESTAESLVVDSPGCATKTITADAEGTGRAVETITINGSKFYPDLITVNGSESSIVACGPDSLAEAIIEEVIETLMKESTESYTNAAEKAAESETTDGTDSCKHAADGTDSYLNAVEKAAESETGDGTGSYTKSAEKAAESETGDGDDSYTNAAEKAAESETGDDTGSYTKAAEKGAESETRDGTDSNDAELLKQDECRVVAEEEDDPQLPDSSMAKLVSLLPPDKPQSQSRRPSLGSYTNRVGVCCPLQHIVNNPLGSFWPFQCIKQEAIFRDFSTTTCIVQYDTTVWFLFTIRCLCFIVHVAPFFSFMT